MGFASAAALVLAVIAISQLTAWHKTVLQLPGTVSGVGANQKNDGGQKTVGSLPAVQELMGLLGLPSGTAWLQVVQCTFPRIGPQTRRRRHRTAEFLRSGSTKERPSSHVAAAGPVQGRARPRLAADQ